ncbi:MAG: tRNA uridine-5-carboxymethylaminomethyl(34) synthesis GTPase MnmE [Hyphomicrobiales bacterium]|nr:tRNA uridine-5-carboxymethylaminomethyl(34) synthesis GTPase MnmE [Hyphomicrobiales bacterium]MBV8441066.1 tRNA uridine-5-carboxymethylaminomethyl(34) synthesis GTPase MnmE [Hyphomicrobiales bacterium]
MYASSRDTIFALASGLGKSAVGVFRISGPACSAALAAVAPGAKFPARRTVLRTVRHPRTLEPIDRALITRFEAPSSFTGEEVVELSVTGGRAVISATARALAIVPGLRPAEPGEFAWRAFVNGKLDLSEVEGLADLVDAETEAQRRQAQRIAGGALRRECEAIRATLISAMAMIEAQIDFSDVEDAENLTLNTVKRAARTARDRIDRALAGANAAERLREGFVVVIAGPPNVGKSTLMNALAGRDVAITSPFAGTTRDLIEVLLDLRGYPVVLVDTAGIREAEDPVEREGVNRALRRAKHADLTLWLDDQDGSLPPFAEGQALAVRTKIDLPESRSASARSPFAISAKTGEGVDKLLDAIGDLAEERLSSSEPAVLTLERHRQAFQEARESLSSVLAPEASEPELVAEDLRRSAAALDRVVGRIGVEDVLGEIFSRLCIGK